MLKKHIVFVWELGGGLGHVAGFFPVAKSLLDKGYQISVISKDVPSAHDVLGKLPINIYQAPIYRKNTDRLNATYSYAEVIFDLGYKSANELYPLVSAWKHLFSLLTPDLVIADHSPSALVACKILDYKTVLIGTGFFSPPAISPLPALVSTQVPDQKKFLQHEKQVLASINEVLKKYDTTPLKYLHQLFDVDVNFLCTLAELDHYPDRGKAHYWGPRFDIDIGGAFTWSQSKATKVFAYIKQSTPGFDTLFEALVSSKKNIVLYIPQANPQVIQTCKNNKQLVLLQSPANMRQVLDQAEVIVCHAGHGVVSAALLKGKRLLLVPSQLEQSMLAYLLAKRRLVAAVNPRHENINYNRAIEFACSNEELGKNIALFKRKYAEFNSSQQVESMVKSCVDIIAS